MRILSLGAGVQSTVMILMAAKGELPMPDYSIFSDTQWEPLAIYDHLDWLEAEVTRLTNGQLPMLRVTAGNIRQDHINGTNTTGQRFAGMPMFVDGGMGMSRRQCTSEYKIAPVRKEVRRLLGVEKGKRVPKGTIVEKQMGITTDEAVRMKPSRDKWETNVWPLIDLRMNRNDCIQWFAKHYPGRVLEKSACIGCPFHNNAMWRDMKVNDPVSFADAVEFDQLIREKGTTLKGMSSQQYLHRSCKPLGEVDFRNLEDKGQLNMFNNECFGMCGI